MMHVSVGCDALDEYVRDKAYLHLKDTKHHYTFWGPYLGNNPACA